jgi:hypothetical protein
MVRALSCRRTAVEYLAFADAMRAKPIRRAAGLAAAQAYGGLAEASNGAIAGTSEQALQTFTLMKVIGRDIWIGIWAFVFALISTLRWEAEPGRNLVALPEICAGLPHRLGARHIHRHGPQLPGLQANDRTQPRRAHQGFAQRGLHFLLSFHRADHVGAKPFLGFTAGVVVNVILGFLLSAVEFAEYWTGLFTPSQ